MQAKQVTRLADFIRGCAKLSETRRNTYSQYSRSLDPTHMCPDGVRPYCEESEREVSDLDLSDNSIRHFYLVPYCRNFGLTFDFTEFILENIVVGNHGPFRISLLDLWSFRFDMSEKDAERELIYITECFYDDVQSDKMSMSKYNAIAAKLHEILTVY